MVRNKRSKTITPTLPTNINNIISLVEDHVPSKTTTNMLASLVRQWSGQHIETLKIKENTPRKV